jgi:hypothetical protein
MELIVPGVGLPRGIESLENVAPDPRAKTLCEGSFQLFLT